MKSLLISFLVLQNIAHAAGGGASDLVFPFLNFFLLFGGLFIILKKSIPQKFTSWSESIEKSYEDAQIRSREASLKLEEAESKFNNLPGERDKIISDAKSMGQEIQEKINQEARQKEIKIKDDTVKKIEAEKDKLVRGLNNKLINKVIEGARSKISNDPAGQTKASKKLLTQI